MARIAAPLTTGGFLAAAAMLAGITLVCARSTPPEPPPPEPEVYCVVPDVSLASPCARPDDRIALSTATPTDRGAGAFETASGLRVRVLTPACGPGAHPSAADVAQVAYVGWNARGDIITNGVENGELPLRALIPGFAEAVERMQPGEQLRVWIPARLAYGDSRGQRYAGDLTFDLQLAGYHPDPRD